MWQLASITVRFGIGAADSLLGAIHLIFEGLGGGLFLKKIPCKPSSC